jgi:hypothetical protein
MTCNENIVFPRHCNPLAAFEEKNSGVVKVFWVVELRTWYFTARYRM